MPAATHSSRRHRHHQQPTRNCVICMAVFQTQTFVTIVVQNNQNNNRYLYRGRSEYMAVCRASSTYRPLACIAHSRRPGEVYRCVTSTLVAISQQQQRTPLFGSSSSSSKKAQGGSVGLRALAHRMGQLGSELGLFIFNFTGSMGYNIVDNNVR